MLGEAEDLCINRLTSARARRERYVGPWLPEPVATGNDPRELVERRDTVSLGFWADGGGKAIAARELSVIEVNNAVAVLVHESGELTGVLVPEIHDGSITMIRAILNPDKLTYLRTQLPTYRQNG